MKELKDKLIEKIKAGEIKMVPKWKLVLNTFLWVAALTLVALITVYLFSFIIFVLHRSGVLFAPLYGWSGFMLFIVSSPWILILVLGAFLFLLYILVSHYSFSYRKPLVYSIVGIVLFVIAVSSLIQQAALHDRLRPFIERHDVPGLAPMYRRAVEERPEGVVTGTIVEFGVNTVNVETVDDTVFVVSTTSNTKIPRRGINVGDEVVVMGDIVEGGIKAFGIRPSDFGKQLQRPKTRPTPILR